MTPTQVEALRETMNVRAGCEWDPFEGPTVTAPKARTFLDAVPFVQRGRRRFTAAEIAVPDRLDVSVQPAMSTQQGLGPVMHEIAKSETALADRIVTTAPDVTVSTNLGAWVNRRGLFSKETMADLFKAERILELSGNKREFKSALRQFTRAAGFQRFAYVCVSSDGASTLTDLPEKVGDCPDT